MQPLVRRDLSEESWAAMGMNLAANLLGLGNAATPFGIRAAQLLAGQGADGLRGLLVLLVINNSGLELMPSAVMTLRQQAGSVAPGAIWLPTLAAHGHIDAGGGGAFVLDGQEGKTWIAWLGPWCWARWAHWRCWAVERSRGIRRVSAWSGGRPAHRTGNSPALAAMMLLIGLFRTGGLAELLEGLLGPLAEAVGFPREALTVLLLRPLSGAGSLAALETLMAWQGPDSRASMVASVVVGSSETIFYTMTVYLSAAGVRKLPRALSISLISWFAGCLAAAWLC